MSSVSCCFLHVFYFQENQLYQAKNPKKSAKVLSLESSGEHQHRPGGIHRPHAPPPRANGGADGAVWDPGPPINRLSVSVPLYTSKTLREFIALNFPPNTPLFHEDPIWRPFSVFCWRGNSSRWPSPST